MDKERKTKLIDILNREELTFYDAGILFKSIGDLFQGYEAAGLRAIEETKEDANNLVTFAKEVVARLIKAGDEMEQEFDRYFDRAYAAYERVSRMRKELDEKFSGLREEFKEIQIPYGLKALLEVCETLSRVDDRTVAAVIKVAEAMAGQR